MNNIYPPREGFLRDIDQGVVNQGAGSYNEFLKTICSFRSPIESVPLVLEVFFRAWGSENGRCLPDLAGVGENYDASPGSVMPGHG